MTERASWPTFAYWAVAHKVERWRRGDTPVAPQPDTVELQPARYLQPDLFTL